MPHFVDPLEPRRLFAINAVAVPINGGSDNAAFVFNPSGEARMSSVAATFKVSKTGTLFVTGTGRADHYWLNISGGKIAGGSKFYLETTIDAASAGGTFVRLTDIADPTSVKVYAAVDFKTLPKIKRVVIEGQGGDDDITIAADVPVTVRGARGNDTLNVFASNRTIVGGSGSNTIRDGDRREVVFAASAIPNGTQFEYDFKLRSYYVGDNPLTR